MSKQLAEFYDDLEGVFKKHLGKDWEWTYNSYDDYQLILTSETLAQLWDEMDEDYPDSVEDFVEGRNKKEE